ncbi:MAG: rRNA maturation RNase YbeY [Flavobacteriales bacterium]|nr:rRNA maturation RNase YbeY [Flavobacteriales bacterium]MBK7943140.1 rRNA maturation RNase YbeY [Flavobacteriales bacterium]MBK8947360.1 rRNA maturation RNase YbeY [Flavobacteriales bacterium]MBK9701807.1 rRNA maturation RNase YbeY [Flavobacteriales bacterium]
MAHPVTFLVQDVPDPFRDRTRLRHWLQRVAADHGSRIDRVCFVAMGSKALLAYNRTYLRHDDHTDVITFPVESSNGANGDVLMSLERIRENAAEYGVSARHELHRVMVHGLLHLLGHTDRTKAQKAAMRALEDKYLAWLD